MVAEVNKIIAGELLNHRSVVIPGVGTLYVAHRGARRLSRQKIAAPRNEIDFRPSEEGVSLVELIRRAGGMSLTQAAVSAAKARLRPILMTVLTCVFGMIPLMLSHGVGANGNSTLGSGVVGGMIVGTLALLFLVPTLFIVFQTLQEKIKPVEFTSPDWCIQAEIEENQKEPIDEEAKTDDDTK